MKKMIQSKSFYMMMMSLLTLLLSLIEYFVVIYATPYAFLPRFMGIIILISLYAYAFSLKKIQTKYNVLVLIYILQWIGSIFVCWIIELSGKLEIRNHFFLSSMNLMFSIIMIIVNLIVLIFRYRKEKIDTSFVKNEALHVSTCLFMIKISFAAFTFSCVECIVLTYAQLAALFVMIPISVAFLILFIYILIIKKYRKELNYLIIVYCIVWSLSSYSLFLSSITAWSNGIKYIFPVLILSNANQSFLSIYINWIFSLFMCILFLVIHFIHNKKLENYK